MDEVPHKSPFRPLGRRLKALRDRANESLAEASGAVEIDVKLLASYELGQSRPSEEILLLLISHFGVRDDDAVNLWELAGYGNERVFITNNNSNDDSQQNSTDPNNNNRILFTDTVDVVVNNYGVVMNFMQGMGPNSKPVTISRVGMSREHAKSVLHILQVTLNQTENITPINPKRINNSENKKSPDEKTSN
jgi:transcriptional regulator with XRE-family HTH domain